jgi:hypothetical protein
VKDSSENWNNKNQTRTMRQNAAGSYFSAANIIFADCKIFLRFLHPMSDHFRHRVGQLYDRNKFSLCKKVGLIIAILLNSKTSNNKIMIKRRVQR